MRTDLGAASEKFMILALRELAHLANSRGHGFLSYLVLMALEEAEQIAAGHPTIVDGSRIPQPHVLRRAS